MWMRFGKGLYKVDLGNNNIFTVTNTCTDTGADGDPRFKYPSSVVQSDDFRITNILSDILYGINKEADKIKKINDYLVQNTLYDVEVYNQVINNQYDSFTGRQQDALSVLGTRYHFDPQYDPAGHYFAVCEGYSCAAAALLRAAGIETKYISSSSMNHGWNNVYTGGSWKFLDVTWNDPVNLETGFDGGPYSVSYKYYLLTSLNGINGDHYGGSTDNFRGIKPVPVIPKMRGMPDGWY
jgi:transglutaminase/protease-like cytokinesis protein 3